MSTTNYSFAHTRRLNEICDCPCGCRELNVEEFRIKNLSELPAHLKVEYLYILGKFFFHRAKSENRLENLERSNSYFNQIFMVSKHARLEVKSPKKWFKAAHTKYVLSKEVDSAEDSEMLKKQALKIAEKAAARFLENKSIAWLLDEINN